MSSSAAYDLHPLLYPALPAPQDGSRASPAALARSVRCAEGNGNLLYVGGSDGVLHLYSLPEGGEEDYQLVKSRVVSSNGKAIERILPLAAVGLIAVLAGELHAARHALLQRSPLKLHHPSRVKPHLPPTRLGECARSPAHLRRSGSRSGRRRARDGRSGWARVRQSMHRTKTASRACQSWAVWVYSRQGELPSL